MFSRIKRALIPFLAAIFIIAIAAGCTKVGAKKAPSIYERFGLKLEVPDEYEGIVDFDSADKLDDNTFIKAYHISSRDAGCGGWLYSIVRHTKDEFDEYEVMMEGAGGSRHFASDENYIYSLEFPTDVQIAPEYWESAGSGADASISELTNEDAIMADFIERNGLTPYQVNTSVEASLPTRDSAVEKFLMEHSNDNEKTYKLGAIPVKCETGSGTETVYLTSITLRSDSAMCNFICSSKDAPIPIFPDIIAVAADKKEYKLSDQLSIKGASCFECTDVPVNDITILNINGVDFQINSLPSNLGETDVFLDRLNDLPDMSYSELFAYSRGSDGAYAEGVFSEMAKRFKNNPEEFAVHMMMPAYPIADDYKTSLSVIDYKYESTKGFDWLTNYEICYFVLNECTPEERDAAIKALSRSDYEIVKEANSLFSVVAESLNKA